MPPGGVQRPGCGSDTQDVKATLGAHLRQAARLGCSARCALVDEDFDSEAMSLGERRWN